jgi:dTDP-4-dehydrorhamnose 3,5-epimerase
MIIYDTLIPDVKVIEPRVFDDPLGSHFESFNDAQLRHRLMIRESFIQESDVSGEKNTLRGLSYQLHQPQGLLIRALRGETYHVAVDVRHSSPFFGKWVGVYINEENRRILWIPAGFAHGSLVVTEMARLLIKTTAETDPDDERVLVWNDPVVGVDWPLWGAQPNLSERDSQGRGLREAEVYLWSEN